MVDKIIKSVSISGSREEWLEAFAAWNTRPPAGDDALVEELAEAMVGDYSSHADLQNKMAQRRRFARAILPILHRREAAAHAAGRAEGAEEMRHRALVICADQSYLDKPEQTTSQRIRAIEIDAIERGQHKEPVK